MSISMSRRDLLKYGTTMGTGLLFHRCARGQSTETQSETQTYKTVGDLAIKLDVYRHHDELTRAAVVWIHGGALIGGNRSDIDRRVRKHVLEAGHILISLDYRLAPETQLAEIVHDVDDAFDWIRRNGPRLFKIDPTRIAVAGGSAGGYLTLTSGFRVRPRPAALFSLFGYGDLIGDWYSTPSPHPRHNHRKVTREEAFRQVSGTAISDSRDRKGDGGMFYEYCRQTGTWPKAVSGWDPMKQPERFYPFMAVKNVSAEYPPTVLIHGTNDTDVPYEQSVLMAEQFKQHKVPHEFLSIPNGEHGLRGGDPKLIDAAYAKAFAFVDRAPEKIVGWLLVWLHLKHGITVTNRATACCLSCILSLGAFAPAARGLEPIPDKLVVLTFDDSARSHYTTVRPILKRFGFGATFFVTEGFDFPTNKTDYMTWEQIAELQRDGFEIGNHTGNHASITKKNVADLDAQLEAINRKCAKHGIPRTTSFAYPGNAILPDALPVLKKAGIRLARRGGSPEYDYREGRGFAYEPGLDHPLLIPSAGDARPDWTLDNFIKSAEQARHGRIAVLQFHGIPDTAHDWVSSSTQNFDAYMNYLAKNKYTVVAMRDLARYVDADVTPSDPQKIIDDRKQSSSQKSSRENFRRPQADNDLRFWLKNMIADHGFTGFEASAATGLSTDEIAAAVQRFSIQKHLDPRPANSMSVLKVLPYPGGRHPRIGFLDGAIRPQRETKFSAFLPWDLSQYVVVDLPEAIWVKRGKDRELLYLAHTHVPTLWTRQGISLEPLEWIHENGSLRIERTLPNKVAFGATVVPTRDAIRMELWLTNKTDETLSGLVVQNCVMLKGASEFNSISNDNKLFRKPFVVCRNAAGNRWIITAWENCQRTWGNAPCPCMHSDPQFPDCAPGETQRLHGWLSFYEGSEIEAELQRINRSNRRQSPN